MLACTVLSPFHLTTYNILVIILGIFFKVVSRLLIPSKFQIQENISYWIGPNQQSSIIVLLYRNSIESQYLLFEGKFDFDIEGVINGKIPAGCIYNTTEPRVKKLECFTVFFNMDVVYPTKEAPGSIRLNVIFAVGSLFVPRVFAGYPDFSISQRANIFIFRQIDQDRGATWKPAKVDVTFSKYIVIPAGAQNWPNRVSISGHSSFKHSALGQLFRL